MTVIAHLRIPADSFELGRILDLEDGVAIELETMVPLGEKAVPFLSVSDGNRETFEERIRNHPSVESIREMSSHDNRTLYALDWNIARDVVFQGFLETGAQLLAAKGTERRWEFELRFPTHGALSEFQEYCSNAHISLEVGRIYNPTAPGTGPWHGLSKPQRDTLTRAVEAGYYSIPRELSTKDLAEEFGVSDQAVTERLRRAIVALVENTLVAAEREEFEQVE